MDKTTIVKLFFVYFCYTNLVNSENKPISLLDQKIKVKLIIEEHIIKDVSRKYLNLNYFGNYSDIDRKIIGIEGASSLKEIYRIIKSINENSKIDFVLVLSNTFLIEAVKFFKINKPVFFVNFQALGKQNQVNKILILFYLNK